MVKLMLVMSMAERSLYNRKKLHYKSHSLQGIRSFKYLTPDTQRRTRRLKDDDGGVYPLYVPFSYEKNGLNIYTDEDFAYKLRERSSAFDGGLGW